MSPQQIIQSGRTKRALFWVLLIFLVLASIELPFRFFDYLQDRAFKKAQAELTVISDEELPPLDDRGWRVIDDFKDIDLLKKIFSDIFRLRTGYVHNPDYRLLKRAPYFTFKVNNMGFRGPDWNKRKEKDEIRVFIIGGSTAFSMVSDEEHSIHSQLERFLNNSKSNTRKQYRVYSAALPSLNSFHELAIVRKLIVQFNPDIVVAINGFNDAGGNHILTKTHLEREDKEDTVTRMYRMLASLSNNALVKRSSVAKYFSEKLNIWSYPKFEARKDMPVTDSSKSAAEVYIENMMKMRGILDTHKSKFLVYLQPSLILPGGKPLTKTEQRVRELWSTPGNIKSYGRFSESYPLMLQFLQDKGFDYINGQKLGTHGLAVGTVDLGESVLLKSEAADTVPVQQINVTSDASKSLHKGRIVIEHQDGTQKIILEPAVFCGSSVVQLMYDGTSVSTCTIQGGDDLLKRSVDRTMWNIGYQGVAYASPNDYLTLRFDSPTPIRSGSWIVSVSNAKDADDVIVRPSISFDGIHYTSLREKGVSFGRRKEITWDWDASLGTGRTVFLRVSLARTNNYLGLDGMQVTLLGKQRNFWDSHDTSLRVVNKSDNVVYMESLRRVGGEGMFIDAAHLNFKGNAMVAQQIATYILDHRW